MRTDFPARLQLELNSPDKRLAYYWKVTRTDGKVFGFTDHDRDITLADGITYKAGTGLTPSAIKSTSDLSPDNMDLEVLIDSEVLVEAELLNGLWDFAKLECGVYVYTSPLNSSAVLKTGTLGSISLSGHLFKAEMRGILQQLQQDSTRTYTAECTVKLGSTRCGVNMASYTHTGTISQVISAKEFVVSVTQADNYFKDGTLTVSSGIANGFVGDIVSNTGATIKLMSNLEITPSVGDSIILKRGCDRRFDTCKTFNNVINFQGFPHMAGNDTLTKGIL